MALTVAAMLSTSTTAKGRAYIERLEQESRPLAQSDYVFPDPMPVPIEMPAAREGPTARERMQKAGLRLKLVGSLEIIRSPRPLHEAAGVGDISEITTLIGASAETEAAGREYQKNAPSTVGVSTSASAEPAVDAGKGAGTLGQGIHSPTERDSDGRTPLHFAACHGHEEACSALLHARADINAADRSKQTALHFAAAFGHAQLVQSLISLPGCDATARDISLQTPLHVAIRRGSAKAAQHLRHHPSGDAASRMRDIEGCLPLALAPTAPGKQLATECDKVVASIKRIAQFGGEEELSHLLQFDDAVFVVGWRDKDGRGLIHYAACHGRAGMCTLMLSPPHTPNSVACASAVDKRGFTPMHYAASWGHINAMVALLIACPENDAARLVSAHDNQGLTPLHCAAMEGREEAAAVLLMRGASVSTTDRKNRTPADVACNDIMLNLLGKIRAPPKPPNPHGLQIAAPNLGQKRSQYRLARGGSRRAGGGRKKWDSPSEPREGLFPPLQDTGSAQELALDAKRGTRRDHSAHRPSRTRAVVVADADAAMEQLRSAFVHRQRLHGHSEEDTRLAFMSMDKDGDDELDIAEFEQAIYRLGMGLTDAQVSAVAQKMDLDSDGHISFEEFLAQLHKPAQAAEQEASGDSNAPFLSEAVAWLDSAKEVASTSRVARNSRALASQRKAGRVSAMGASLRPSPVTQIDRPRVCGVDVQDIITGSQMEEGGGQHYIDAFKLMVNSVL